MDGELMAVLGPQTAALCNGGDCFGEKRRKKMLAARAHKIGQPDLRHLEDVDWVHASWLGERMAEINDQMPEVNPAFNVKGAMKDMASKRHRRLVKVLEAVARWTHTDVDINAVTKRQPKPDKHKEFRRRRDTIRGRFH